MLLGLCKEGATLLLSNEKNSDEKSCLKFTQKINKKWKFQCLGKSLEGRPSHVSEVTTPWFELVFWYKMEPVWQISRGTVWNVSSGRNTNMDMTATMVNEGTRNNLGNMSVYSSSTGTSSVFSSEEDAYEQRVREIEEYYVKTLLNEDNDEEEGESGDAAVDQEWNNSETSSISSSPAKSPFTFNDNNNNNNNDKNGKPVLDDVSGRIQSPKRSVESGVGGKKELEVKINAEYAPSSDLLPLTTENLERLTLTSEKTPRKSPVQIKKTTKSGHEGSNSVGDANSEEGNRGLYKTELCESFTTKGTCRYGSKCQFAHGLSELKFRQFGNNFRTKPCVNWSKLGYCPYGKRCCFKHGSDQDIKVYLKAGTYLSNSEKETKKNLHANVKALQKITW